MICWHYDHSVSRNVKGVHMVNLLYSSKGVNLPISFEIIKKTKTCIDKKRVGKNESAQSQKMRCFVISSVSQCPTISNSSM